MGTILAVLWGIIMLMILVILHELGHFWAAKKLGVKVLEFGVGIPPKAKKLWTDVQGTEYTLNRIPLGGFVRLKWENPDDEAEFLAPDSLITAPLWRKIVILLAGIAMNFLTTYLLFVIVFAVGVRPIQVISDAIAPQWHMSYILPTISSLNKLGYVQDDQLPQSVLIEEVMPDWVGQTLGLVPWDQVISINNLPTNSLEFSAMLVKYRWQEVPLQVQHENGQTKTIMYLCEDQCVLWVVISQAQLTDINTIKMWRNSRWSARYELKAQTRLTRQGLGRIGDSLFSFDAKKTQDWLKGMSGPAWVIKAWQQIFMIWGWSGYLAFAGLISLSLALFNLLPIPALDGGRVVWSIIQAVGRFKPQKYFVIENYINMFFFVVLMGLGIYILGQDLVRARGLFGG